ncbi:MAG: hypothetical protein ACI3XA_05675 [Clostridia bacterium]
MKKSYTTPIFDNMELEDILLTSNLDNAQVDIVDDNYDDESGWMIAD